ncbi:MAG TPA: metallophosphoesterase family protein [Thermoleophilaceae bacterium]
MLQLIERQRGGHKQTAPRRRPRLRLPSRRGLLRGVALVAAVIALAVGGILLGLRAAGDTTRNTAIGSVSFAVSPAWHGQVDAFIPIADWGVRAHAFRVPLKIHVEPRAVRRGAVVSAASGNGTVLAVAERDSRHAARAALLHAGLWGVGGALALGVIAALALAHRPGVRRRTVAAVALAPAVCAVALCAGVLLRLSATFDSDAFSHPRFYARGAELEQLLRVASNAQEEAAGYTSQVQRALGSFAALVATGARFARPVPATREAILASDLHDNLLAMKAVRNQFGRQPIFFPGDFGQTGSSTETRLLVSSFKRLTQPVIAVSGNHDSALLMRHLAAAGVIVLTDRGRLNGAGRTDDKPVQTILGMRVAGYPDPLESRHGDPADPRRIFSFADRPNGKLFYAAAEQRLLNWFESLKQPPQVLLVHQNGLSQYLARSLQLDGYRRRLVILTGHDHRQHIDKYGPVVVVDGGSVGAGGVFGASKTPVGFAHLNLTGGGQLASADLVRAQPFTGGAQADRVVLTSSNPCRGQALVCHKPGGP